MYNNFRKLRRTTSVTSNNIAHLLPEWVGLGGSHNYEAHYTNGNKLPAHTQFKSMLKFFNNVSEPVRPSRRVYDDNNNVPNRMRNMHEGGYLAMLYRGLRLPSGLSLTPGRVLPTYSFTSWTRNANHAIQVLLLGLENDVSIQRVVLKIQNGNLHSKAIDVEEHFHIDLAYGFGAGGEQERILPPGLLKINKVKHISISGTPVVLVDCTFTQSNVADSMPLYNLLKKKHLTNPSCSGNEADNTQCISIVARSHKTMQLVFHWTPKTPPSVDRAVPMHFSALPLRCLETETEHKPARTMARSQHPE